MSTLFSQPQRKGKALHSNTRENKSISQQYHTVTFHCIYIYPLAYNFIYRMSSGYIRPDIRHFVVMVTSPRRCCHPALYRKMVPFLHRLYTILDFRKGNFCMCTATICWGSCLNLIWSILYVLYLIWLLLYTFHKATKNKKVWFGFKLKKCFTKVLLFWTAWFNKIIKIYLFHHKYKICFSLKKKKRKIPDPKCHPILTLSWWPYLPNFKFIVLL